MEQTPPRRDEAQASQSLEGEVRRPGSDPESLIWRQFAEATTPKAFCQGWLPLQCRMLSGVRCAMALLGNADAGPYSPVAVWPDARVSMNHLTGAAEQALKERRGLLLDGKAPSGHENNLPETYHVAYPIEVSGKLHGVAGVILGTWSNCTSGDSSRSLSLETVFSDYFSEAPYPVLVWFPFGHERDNATLPIGGLAELSTDDLSLSLIAPPIR